MKKTYVYFLIPLIAVAIFGAVYWNYLTTFEAKEAARVKEEKNKKEAKLRAEAESREKAIKDALVAQDRRRKEREAKDEKDRLDREAREASIEARRKAYNEKEKFTRQVDRLKADVRVENDAIKKIEETKKGLVEDEAFLKTYVTKVEANEKKLAEIIDKIDLADKAAAERAKADAAAAQKAKNS